MQNVDLEQVPRQRCPASQTLDDGNVLQGPGLAELDLSASKKFFLTERWNLQFRAELFNLFNRANLNTPNPVVFATAAPAAASPTAGVISSTTTTSRQVQFGLKLLW